MQLILVFLFGMYHQHLCETKYFRLKHVLAILWPRLSANLPLPDKTHFDPSVK